MILQLDKNILIEEVAKWKQKIQNGELSQKSIKTIKKAGVAKTDSQLADGLNQGTMNLMAKHRPDFKINKDVNVHPLMYAVTGGAYMSPREKTINNDPNTNIVKRVFNPFAKVIPTQANNDTNKLLNAIALRHEAYEAMEADKKGRFGNVNGEFVGKYSGMPFGKHMSANVLNNEANVVNNLKYTDAGKIMSNYRTKSGEKESMKNATGVDYDKVNNNNVNRNAKVIKDHERTSGKYQIDDKAMIAKQIALNGALIAAPLMLSEEATQFTRPEQVQKFARRSVKALNRFDRDKFRRDSGIIFGAPILAGGIAGGVIGSETDDELIGAGLGAGLGSLAVGPLANSILKPKYATPKIQPIIDRLKQRGYNISNTDKDILRQGAQVVKNEMFKKVMER